MSCNIVVLDDIKSGTAHYSLPIDQSAKLTFGPDDISSMRVMPDGSLTISLSAGGEIVISNFTEMADAGQFLFLADGSMVSDAGLPLLADNDNGTIIGMPDVGVTQELAFEPGQIYGFNFDRADIASATAVDGKLILTFVDGGTLVLANYAEAAAWDNAPRLDLTDLNDSIALVDLTTALGVLTEGLQSVGEDIAALLKTLQEQATDSADRLAELQERLAKVQPGAGPDDLLAEAQAVANIEPAAGGDTGPSSNGYGFNSTPGSDPLIAPDAVGPLGVTALAYNAPTYKNENYIEEDASTIDSIPVICGCKKDFFLDETNFTGGPLVATGTVSVAYGSDGPGGIAPNGIISITGSVAGAVLSSNGVPVTIETTTDSYIGKAGGTVVFTLTIDPVTGAFTYTQVEPFDHADATNPDDRIDLMLGLTATDADGDKATTAIKITVADDAPGIVPTQSTVDETDLGPVSVSGTVPYTFGGDGAGSFVPTGTFTPGGSMKSGALTHGGVPVTVALVGDTYTGTAGGLTIFTIEFETDGKYTFKLFDTLDHGDPNDPNDIINLDFGVRVKDYDGDAAESFVRIRVKDDVPTIEGSRGGVDESTIDVAPLVYSDTLDTSFGMDAATIVPGGEFSASANGAPLALTSGGVAVIVTQTANGYTGTAGGASVFTLTIDPVTGRYVYTQTKPLDHPDATDHNDDLQLTFSVDVTSNDGDSDTANIVIDVLDDGLDARNDINGAEEDQLITGDLFANDELSNDGSNVVTTVVFGGTTHTIPAGGSTTITATYGTLIVKSDGTYSYQATAEDPDGSEVFTYTARDRDGDKDSATLTIRVTPDGEPVAVTKTFDVDETNLTPGPMIFNGTLDVDFGRDGVGSVTGNNQFSSAGSKLGGALTHHGVPVTVALVGDTYTGTAGGQTIFTMKLNNDGTYKFQLLGTLDHADSTDPNDVIRLNFGVQVADKDGDTANGTVTIHVHDDAPVAYDETLKTVEEGATVTGNVLTNDELGEDSPNDISFISFGANKIAVNGPTTIIGTYGTLVINDNGVYTYTPNANHPDGTDTFTYTLRDYDGDQDTAELTIKVSPDFAPVVVNAHNQVDETGGFDTVSGTVSVNYGGDGPGVVMGTNVFSSSYALTSVGVPVVVSFNAGTNTYTGKAGATTVFTMVVNANGTYTFTQLDQLDHANASDPNDAMNLVFGIKATDTDGDIGTGNITIKVLDDGPTAVDDKICIEVKPDDKPVVVNGQNQVDETSGFDTVSGTVTVNYGSDDPGIVTGTGAVTSSYALTSAGVPVVVSFNAGTNTYTGVAGATTVFTLKVHGSGYYTFTQLDQLDHANASDPNDSLNIVFGVKATDADGDSGTGTITIKVLDDGPVANDDAHASVAENATASGNVTTNDTVGADAPGTVTKLMFNGTAYTVPATGQLTVNGLFGTLKISATGAYTYTGKNDANGVDVFTYTLADKDGDTDTALLSFCVAGKDTNPVIVNGHNQVDETGGFDTVSGTVSVNYGEDTAGSSGVTGTGTFTSSYALKHNGTAVTVTYNAATGIYTGKAGTVTVFTMDLNANGSYTFKQFAELDHAAKGLNGVNHNDAVDLVFGVQATDSDGDVGKGNVTIKVLDDGPVAKDDAFAKTIGNPTSPLGFLGAPVATGYQSNKTWINLNVLANDTVGADNGPAYKIQSVKIISTTAGTDDTQVRVASGGRSIDLWVDLLDGDGAPDKVVLEYTLVDSDGDTDTARVTVDLTDRISPLILDLDGDGVELLNASAGVKFDMDNDGDKDTTGWVAKDDGLLAVDTNNDGVINNQSELFGNTDVLENGFAKLDQYDSNNDGKIDATDANFSKLIIWKDANSDGVSQASEMKTLTQMGIASIDLNVHTADFDVAGNKITHESSFTFTNGNQGQIVDAWFSPNATTATTSSNGVIVGNVITNDNVGQDLPGRVGSVTIGGAVYTIAPGGTTTVLGQYGTLVIGSNGDYTFTAKDGIITHVEDVFTYTLIDYDGDISTAKLTMCVKGTPEQDDQPVLVNGTNQVDETGGFDTVSGTVSVNYGGDGPGVVTGTNVFSSTYALTSSGVPVSVTYNAGTNTYTGAAGGTTVFTMLVNANGTYTFRQFDQLDHANASDPNDALNLVFGVKATDADGDVGTGNVTIKVLDDGPVANDDNGGDVAAGAAKTGNVLTNDVVGADVDGRVIIVNFNGVNTTVALGATATINGAHGSLLIKGDGSYTYTAKAAGNGTDNFTYTLKDYDGDTDPAILSFCVKPVDLDPPTVLVNNGVEKICIKEDGQGTVPVKASYTGGDGDEVLSLTLKGSSVAGWTITAPGWTKVGADWVITLPAGQKTYAGNITFKPPANSDADLPALKVEAKLYDPDTGLTKTSFDDFKVTTDAVADGANLTVPGAVATTQVAVHEPATILTKTGTTVWGLPQTYQYYMGLGPFGVMQEIRYNGGPIPMVTTYKTVQVADGSLYLRNGTTTSPLNLGISLKDTDGSEKVTKIVLQYIPGAANHTMDFNKGTKISKNLYEISVVNGNVAGALAGLTLTVNQGSRSGKLFNWGKIKVTVHSGEVTLSGEECDLTDNNSVITKTIDFYARYSPLVLDLDRDGVELVSIYDANVRFDINNDGEVDRVGWVSKDDGLLAIDTNKDGMINNQSELFGETDVVSNGFANLSQYDENGDGIIDANDAVWNDLIIWQDANTDGISDAGEMITLNQAGIASINLNAAETDYEISDQYISHESTFTYTDGTTGQIVDAWFQAQNVDAAQDLFATDGTADSFLFSAISEAADTIHGFNVTDGDVLDLSALLGDQDGVSESITDFVQMREEAGDTIFSVDVDGLAGPAQSVDVARLTDTSGLDLSDLIDNGNVIV